MPLDEAKDEVGTGCEHGDQPLAAFGPEMLEQMGVIVLGIGNDLPERPTGAAPADFTGLEYEAGNRPLSGEAPSIGPYTRHRRWRHPPSPGCAAAPH